MSLIFYPKRQDLLSDRNELLRELDLAIALISKLDSLPTSGNEKASVRERVQSVLTSVNGKSRENHRLILPDNTEIKGMQIAKVAQKTAVNTIKMNILAADIERWELTIRANGNKQSVSIAKRDLSDDELTELGALLLPTSTKQLEIDVTNVAGGKPHIHGAQLLNALRK